MKNLIKETIVEMFENGDLQIEASIEEGVYNNRVVTAIYYYPDEAMYRTEINRYTTEIE